MKEDLHRDIFIGFAVVSIIPPLQYILDILNGGIVYLLTSKIDVEVTLLAVVLNLCTSIILSGIFLIVKNKSLSIIVLFLLCFFYYSIFPFGGMLFNKFDIALPQFIVLYTIRPVSILFLSFILLSVKKYNR